MREFFINKSRANTDKVGNNAQPIKGQAIKPNEGTDIKPFVKTGRSFTLGNRKKSVQNVETKICGDAGVSACQNSEAPDLGGVNIRKKVSNDLKGLRTANSKHFIENGKRQAVFFGGAVHKKNKSGKYEDIDCCLTDNGKAFEHTEGNLSVAFSKDHENGLLYSLKSGERKAEIYLAGSRGLEENERDIKTDLKANAKVRGIKGKKGEIIAETAKKLQSVCRIENAFQGVDLEYVYKPDRVKENIIVKEKNGSYNFEFVLKLYGLDIQVAEDNKSLFFADAASGKRLLTLPAPFMYDAASNRSDLVSYEIIETQADIYSLRVVADAEWIESAVLPVAIDPTIMIAAEGASIEGEMNDIEIHGFSFDFNNGREVLLGAGDEYSVKIDINLETMLGNAFDVQTRFQNAELRLYQIPSYDSPEKQRFDVYIQVDPAYDVHANWETAKKIDCFERSMNDEGIIIINVTDEVNELFLNGFGQNGHIYIKLQIADNYDGIISLTTEGYYEDIIRPNFIFAYGSARDANPNEAYLNSKAGGAGKGGVNLANGNVLFSHNDTVSDGALTPVVVRHVYDNMSGGYDYAANKKGNSVEVLTDSYGMGKGWKLNIQHESRRI